MEEPSTKKTLGTGASGKPKRSDDGGAERHAPGGHSLSTAPPRRAGTDDTPADDGAERAHEQSGRATGGGGGLERDVDPFDRLAERYERYVPWTPRLEREIPFLSRQLRAAGARRVLDCACGPGRHAVPLAHEGFELVGLDASPDMLERARAHAREKALDIPFLLGRFESLPEELHEGFEGLLCLGNALSAAETSQMLETIVGQFAEVLKPGGVAITQTVDFSVVAKELITPTPLRHVSEGDRKLLFVKSFIRVDEKVLIHWVSLEEVNGKWSSEVTCREVTPVEPDGLMEAFRRSGFSKIERYGDYQGGAFVKGASRDMIVVARRC